MKSILKITKIFSVMTLCLLTGCKSSSTKVEKISETKSLPTQKIKLNIVSEPFNLDPRKARSLNDVNISKMFMEGLTRINKQDEPTLAQAVSVTVSDDQLTYTFKLRDTKWSNGEAVSASDFAYSWKKVLSPDFNSDNAYQLFVIKNAKDIKNGDLPSSLLGVKCPDEKTLVVELEHPVPYFLKLAALPVFFPVNQKVDKKNPNWAYSVETYVGNGPFKMTTWTHHDKIIAQRNQGYWDKSHVKLEEIEMVMVSEDTGLQMFENHELDWEGSPFSALPLDSLPHLDKAKQIGRSAALGTYFVATNTKKKPFDSLNIRKAFASAVNRSELVNHALHGSQVASTGLVPISMGLQDLPYFQDGDVSQAKEYFELGLQELNLTKEDFSSVKLTYHSDKKMALIAQVLQQQWFENLGILVKLEALEGKLFASNISENNFDLSLGSWFADYNDPVTFLDVYTSKENGTNHTQWEDVNVTEGIQNSFLLSSTKERTALLKSVERMIIDAMPIIPLSNSEYLYVKNKGIKDIYLSSLGEIDFRWAYVDNI
jgi:oligopeptide transport system substrate-binding protein